MHPKNTPQALVKLPALTLMKHKAGGVAEDRLACLAVEYFGLPSGLPTIRPDKRSGEGCGYGVV